MKDDDKKVTRLPVDNKRKGNGPFLVGEEPLECRHTGKFKISLAKETCKCMDCGELLSPMFVLSRLMHRESQWIRNRERYDDEMKRLDARSRTRCRHCGKMTKISRS